MGKTDVLLKLGYALVGLAGLAFSACSSRPAGEAHPTTGVTFVFEDSAAQGFLGQRKAVFSYLDGNSLPVEIRFPNDSISWEMVVPSRGKWLELIYRDHGGQEYVRLFGEGDSVLVSMANRNLWFTTLNREVLPYDDNLELQGNTNGPNSSYTPLQDFYFLWESSRASVAAADGGDELQEYKDRALESLKLEADWLDSLEKAGQLSSYLASFFLSKNQFEQDKLRFFDLDGEVFDADAALRYFVRSESVNANQAHTLYLDRFGDFLIDRLVSEEYRELASRLILEETGVFSDLVLYKFLNRELSMLSFQEAEKLFETYSGRLDPKPMDLLKAENEKLLHLEQDMQAKSLGEGILDFGEIVEKKKGTILYVDLWAAWCIPCIRSFPESRKLQADYHGRGIEVIYLSVDQNHKFWDQVVRKYDIALPDRSFIVMNSAESAYLKELHVESIPRYLLYDRAGHLIHKNAPRPGSGEIRTLLDSLGSK